MDVNPIESLNQMFQNQQHTIERLEESLAQRVLQLDDIGWTPLNPNSEDEGISLETLKNVTPRLRDMAATNPLHVRGAQLRHAYIFGRGVNFTGLSDKTREIIENPYNQAALFSVQAYATINAAKFTDGNLFVLRDEDTNILTLVPLREITGFVTDPDDNSKVRYFQRTWTANEKERVAWYPLSRYKKSIIGRGKRGKLPKTINKAEVAQRTVIYHETTKRQVGWTFGVPDSLAAVVHSAAYSEYLADSSKLSKALMRIAWSISTASKSGAKNASVQVAQPGSAGGTAVMGGHQLSGVGVPSAQVNYNNGQPIAAMVASSFGVPVIALLSSPGATGGSYGAASTLDEPTRNGMRAEQDSWTNFFVEILRDTGSPEASAQFPNITQDPTYREAQTLTNGYIMGAIHQDEYRNSFLNLVDVERLHTEVPKPDEFNSGKSADYTGDEETSDPIARQGNTGAVPGGNDQGVTNHDNDGV